MKKQLSILLLVAMLVPAGPLPMAAQVFNTGPAGLARQMPRIYGPHMANSARLKYLQKRKRSRRPPKHGVVQRRPSRAKHPSRAKR